MNFISFREFTPLSSFFKETLIPSLSVQQKKITALAILALGCLALLYFWCCCNFEGDEPVDDSTTSKTRDIYKEVVEDKDKSFDELLNEADHSTKMQYYPQAASKYKVALTKGTTVGALKGYATVLHKQGKYGEAAEQFQLALKIEPKDIFLITHLGDCLLQQGQLDQAAEILQEALKIGPRNFLALEKYAETLFKQGKFSEADEYYKKAEKIDNAQFKNLVAYGKTLLALGKTSEAIYFYANEKVGAHILETLQEFLQRDNIQTAVDLCITFLKERAYTYYGTENCVSQINSFAEELIKMGRLDDAAKIFKEVEDKENWYHYLDKQKQFAFSRHANILASKNDRNAATYFNSALDLDRTCVFTLSRYGHFLLSQGELEKAKEHLTQALKFKPDHILSLNFYGHILNELGELSEACAQFEKVLGLDPENVYALSHYGNVLYKQDKFAEAEKKVRAALAIEPKNELALKTLGFILRLRPTG